LLTTGSHGEAPLLSDPDVPYHTVSSKLNSRHELTIKSAEERIRKEDEDILSQHDNSGKMFIIVRILPNVGDWLTLRQAGAV
jgi:hypothetical protein